MNRSICQRLLWPLTFLLFVLLSCQRTSDNSSDLHKTIRVVDFRGKELLFNKPPERIVCLIESALSGFYMLNAESSIVGISSNVYEGEVYKYYAALDKRIKSKTLDVPGNWDFISIENIVASDPDLVVIWASQTEAIESIEAKGIPVYAVMLKSVSDIYKEIEDFGVITGKEKRADSLIKFTKNELKKNSVKSEGFKTKKQKVYFMWSQGALETSGVNSTVNELITTAGAINACPEKEEHLVVNLEKVIDWNPDVIVMWTDANRNPSDIINLPGWNNISAVKNQRVFELPSVFLCDLWTLKFQYAVKLLSSWCYPDEYKDFNPVNEKSTMLKSLYGIKGGKIK